MGVGKTTFTFSTSSITVNGGSTNINLTRDNQSYTNKLSHGYGDIYTFPAGATDYTWKPTAAQLTKFFEEVSSQKTRLIDVYLDTYNGSTKVGRDTHALTVTLSEETGKPAVSIPSIGTADPFFGSNAGIVVYPTTTVDPGVSASARYGATLEKASYTYGSIEYVLDKDDVYDPHHFIASMPLTTTPTSYTYYLNVVDSRGFSATCPITQTIVKYEAPSIDRFEVVRCDDDGNKNENGTKAKVTIKGSWAAMKVGTAYKNPATLKVGYKTKAATSYTYQTISVSDGTVDISQLLSYEFNAGTDYEFSVELADKVQTCSESGVGFLNSNNIIYVSADGKELIIGNETGNNVVIDSDSVDIRDGSVVNASFSANRIDIGKNNSDAVISMRNDTLTISSTDSVYNGNTFDSDADLNLRAARAKSSTTDVSISMGEHNGSSVISINSARYAPATGNPAANIILTSTDDKGSIRLTTSENSGELGDWVVESGTSGNQTYRKWASGITDFMPASWVWVENTASTTYTASASWSEIAIGKLKSGPTNYSNFYKLINSSGAESSIGYGIKCVRSGYYRIKLTVHGKGTDRIGAGIFTSATAGEEYSSFVLCSSASATSASVEAIVHLNVGECRYFKEYGGTAWTKYLAGNLTYQMIEYLGGN